MNLTPDQFYKQWLRLGPAAATVSHFERQVFDFTHLAGRFSQDRFRQSFRQGGFYGSGQPWPARTSRWGRRLTHPVLRHAGTLEQSIDGSLYSDNRTVKPARAARRHSGARRPTRSRQRPRAGPARACEAYAARAPRPTPPCITHPAAPTGATSTARAAPCAVSSWVRIRSSTPRSHATIPTSSTAFRAFPTPRRDDQAEALSPAA